MSDGAWEEIAAALQVVKELRDSGRAREAGAILKLVQVELARQDAQHDDELTLEAEAALAEADADILAGKIIPHEVVMQGPGAVEAYVLRRDAGEVDPNVAAAVEAYRQGLVAERRAAAAGG